MGSRRGGPLNSSGNSHTSCSSSDTAGSHPSGSSRLFSDSGMDLESIAEQVFEQLSVTESETSSFSDVTSSQDGHRLPQDGRQNSRLCLNFLDAVSGAPNRKYYKLFRGVLSWISPELDTFMCSEKPACFSHEHDADPGGGGQQPRRRRQVDIPALAVVLFLQEDNNKVCVDTDSDEAGMAPLGGGKVSQAVDFFKHKPWRFHHSEFIGGQGRIKACPQSNHDYYFLTYDLPLCSVRQIHCGEEHVRLVRFVTARHWASSLALYRLLLGAEPDAIKTDFAVFTVEKYTGCDLQLSLKRLPRGIEPRTTRKAVLSFKVPEIGRLVPLLPHTCCKVADHRWRTYDLDGHEIHLEVEEGMPLPSRQIQPAKSGKHNRRPPSRSSRASSSPSPTTAAAGPRSAFSRVLPAGVGSQATGSRGLADRLSPRVYVHQPVSADVLSKVQSELSQLASEREVYTPVPAHHYEDSGIIDEGSDDSVDSLLSAVQNQHLFLSDQFPTQPTQTGSERSRSTGDGHHHRHCNQPPHSPSKGLKHRLEHGNNTSRNQGSHQFTNPQTSSPHATPTGEQSSSQTDTTITTTSDSEGSVYIDPGRLAGKSASYQLTYISDFTESEPEVTVFQHQENHYTFNPELQRDTVMDSPDESQHIMYGEMQDSREERDHRISSNSGKNQMTVVAEVYSEPSARQLCKNDSERRAQNCENQTVTCGEQAVSKTTRGNGWTMPVNGRTTPVNGGSTPVNGRTTPVNGRTTPVNSGTTPVNGRSTPVNGKTEPANGRTTPVNGRTTPVNGRTTPVNVGIHTCDMRTASVNDWRKQLKGSHSKNAPNHNNHMSFTHAKLVGNSSDHCVGAPEGNTNTPIDTNSTSVKSKDMPIDTNFQTGAQTSYKMNRDSGHCSENTLRGDCNAYTPDSTQKDTSSSNTKCGFVKDSIAKINEQTSSEVSSKNKPQSQFVNKNKCDNLELAERSGSANSQDAVKVTDKGISFKHSPSLSAHEQALGFKSQESGSCNDYVFASLNSKPSKSVTSSPYLHHDHTVDSEISSSCEGDVAYENVNSSKQLASHVPSTFSYNHSLDDQACTDHDESVNEGEPDDVVCSPGCGIISRRKYSLSAGSKRRVTFSDTNENFVYEQTEVEVEEFSNVDGDNAGRSDEDYNAEGDARFPSDWGFGNQYRHDQYNREHNVDQYSNGQIAHFNKGTEPDERSASQLQYRQYNDEQYQCESQNSYTSAECEKYQGHRQHQYNGYSTTETPDGTSNKVSHASSYEHKTSADSGKVHTRVSYGGVDDGDAYRQQFSEHAGTVSHPGKVNNGRTVAEQAPAVTTDDGSRWQHIKQNPPLGFYI